MMGTTSYGLKVCWKRGGHPVLVQDEEPPTKKQRMSFAVRHISRHVSVVYIGLRSGHNRQPCYQISVKVPGSLQHRSFLVPYRIASKLFWQYQLCLN